MNKLLIAVPMLTLAGIAVAEEEKKLSTDVEVGIINTNGNTENTSVKAKIDIKQDLESFRNHFVLSGFYKEDRVFITEDDETRAEDRVTQERYFASAQTDFKLNAEHRGLFLFGSYQEDKFSGFNYQGTVALGYSDQLFKFDNSKLTYSIGPGVAFQETTEVLDTDGTVVTESESDTNGIVRVAADFVYNISENSKFTQTFSSDLSMAQDKNSKTNAETALTANVMKGLALKASYTIDHNTHVPEDRKHADTTTAITFLLSF